MRFELDLSNVHQMGATIEALKNASTDGYKLNAHEKRYFLMQVLYFKLCLTKQKQEKELRL